MCSNADGVVRLWCEVDGYPMSNYARPSRLAALASQSVPPEPTQIKVNGVACQPKTPRATRPFQSLIDGNSTAL